MLWKTPPPESGRTRPSARIRPNPPERIRPNSDWGRPPESGRTQIWDGRPNPAELRLGTTVRIRPKNTLNMTEIRILVLFLNFEVSYIILKNLQSNKTCFSAEFGRPSPIRVRPDSDGRPQSEFGRIRAAVPNPSSAGFGRTGGFGRIRADVLAVKIFARSDLSNLF